MVSDPPPISDALIQKSISVAVDNVFRTMLQREAVFVEKTSSEALQASGVQFQVLGNVAFVGEACGIVYLCLTEGFAQHAVQHMVGSVGADIDLADHDLIKDVIGELTNMTAGGFKNALCDVGYPCKLTLPTIVRGTSVKVSCFKSSIRHIFVFECAGHRVVADIQLNNG